MCSCSGGRKWLKTVESNGEKKTGRIFIPFARDNNIKVQKQEVVIAKHNFRVKKIKIIQNAS